MGATTGTGTGEGKTSLGLGAAAIVAGTFDGKDSRGAWGDVADIFEGPPGAPVTTAADAAAAAGAGVVIRNNGAMERVAMGRTIAAATGAAEEMAVTGVG